MSGTTELALLRCPVCGGRLRQEERTLRCENGHSFDLAKEGYVNLLGGGHKVNTGDSRQMAQARRAFLEKGYFAPLKNALANDIGAKALQGPALDICCGEGYYTSVLSGTGGPVYAFDLSKEMVRLAAKRRESTCFVANIASIPMADASVQTAIHLFAPFHDREFSRILHPDGRLITVVAGARHLMGMKEVLYDEPYENDEAPPDCPSFAVEARIRVDAVAHLESREDVAALVNMTPYGVRSPRAGMARLLALDRLDTELSFVLYVLKKR